MARDRTGIERLFQQKIERAIFSPLSEEDLNRALSWLQIASVEQSASGGIPKNYFSNVRGMNPRDYTAFFTLKRAGIIKEEGTYYCLSEDGVAIDSSLRNEGVYEDL
jgi:hypothetical protein